MAGALNFSSCRAPRTTASVRARAVARHARYAGQNWKLLAVQQGHGDHCVLCSLHVFLIVVIFVQSYARRVLRNQGEILQETAGLRAGSAAQV